MTWQAILEQQSLLTQQTVATDKHSYIPLGSLGVLAVNGDDASSFLQSMLTNDVAALSTNQCQFAALCNPKGRIFGLFLVLRTEDGFNLVLPKSLSGLLKQRLSMFVLRSKVTIEDVTENTALFGLCFNPLAQEADLKLNSEVYQAEQIVAHTCIRIPGDPTRYLCIADRDVAAEMSQQLLANNWQLADENNWRLQDIKAGLPSVLAETSEQFTPQQINLDLIGGVNFKKGCYPGQEVVARMHYLGKPSRRMFMASSHSQHQPVAGSEVVDETGDVQGHIVSAATTQDETKLLISLKLAAIDSKLFLADGSKIDALQALSNEQSG